MSANTQTNNAAETLIKHHFRLLVAGDDVESIQAKAKMETLIEQHCKDSSTLEVIDINEQPEQALANNAVVIPMLLMLEPLPKVTIIGSLRDTAKVMAALRFPT